MTDLDKKCINTIRILSADAVQQADSGHPGMPMGSAAMAYALWMNHLKFDPKDPQWPARDRFILSAGHGSMLLYSLLYLTGYDLTLDDIKNFRQLDSKTPGHPEYHLTPGVETTTGPLGQGFANGVGMAIAQKYLSSVMDKPDFPVMNYHIYAIVSDGDLMEGISSEAASLAGHLKLGNMIYLYDDNHISIEGDTEIAFTENIEKRFEAFGWHLQVVDDGNDVDKISKAISNAVLISDKPSLIKVRTHIGFGSPNKVNSESSHGSPLGDDELRLTKINLGFDPDKKFHVDNDVLDHCRKRGTQGTNENSEWKNKLGAYSKDFPESFAMYSEFGKGELSIDWAKHLPNFPASESGMATRQASGKTLNAIAPSFPFMIGGSADLAPSNNTNLDSYTSFQSGNYSGRNLHFGVREHAMGAILNGITLTNPMIAYGATFLIFSDYMRPAIRLAAIMGIRPIYVFTHDSIALGEDGTTHQPIEQLEALRLIPNLLVLRPADANETSQAWRIAIEHKTGPVALILTRQKLPVFDRNIMPPSSEISRGAYVMLGSEEDVELILIASGSEVHLAISAAKILEENGIKTRVVNMASQELFEIQSNEYRQSVLPSNVRLRITIEAGTTKGWEKYATDSGAMIGIDTYGKSAPGEVLMKEYGISVENILATAESLLTAKNNSKQ
jgi:transketolase